MNNTTISPPRKPANDAGRFVLGVQSSPLPVLIVEGTGQNIILMANSSFLRMSGLEDSQIVGRTLDKILSAIMAAENIEFVKERLHDDKPATWKIDVQRPDGTAQTMCIFDYPLSISGSAPPQHLLTFFVTNEMAAHSIPTSSEMQALYLHAPGFIAITEGPDHRLTFVNESFKQYVGKRQLVGLRVAEAMPETVEQGFIDLLDDVLATGVPFHGKSVPYEFPDLETGEMTRRHGDFVYAAIRDANSNIVGLFCEGYDITPQKEAEAALVTLQTQAAHTSRVNAMGTMATTMAHELNQPLTAILNFASGALRLLEEPDVDIHSLRQATLSIEESGQRAAAIIRTLRDLTDRRVGPNAEVKLKPVVAEALNLVRTSCSVDVQLHADIAADLSLTVDRVQIQQVIINLVRNGCDAVAGLKVQKVSVTAEATEDEVIVSVRDTGLGVEAESTQRIFTWLDSTKEMDMGLGLSICRTIIVAHGGRIWLEDSSEHGSEFRFSLPRQATDLS